MMPPSWCLPHDASLMMPPSWCLPHDASLMMPPSCGCLSSIHQYCRGINYPRVQLSLILPSGSSWRHWRRNRTWQESRLAGSNSWRNLNDEQLNGSAMMTGSRNYATYSTDRLMWLIFFEESCLCLLSLCNLWILYYVLLYNQSINRRQNRNRVEI